MWTSCIVNALDLWTFVRSQGEQLPQERVEWLRRALFHHVLTERECLARAVPLWREREIPYVAEAIASGEPVFRFAPSSKLTGDVDTVVRWLSDIREPDDRIVERVRGMTFSDVLELARKREEERRAGHRNATRIPPDPAGAPAVLAEPSLDAGWRWVWLKSPAARIAEDRAMRHSVGTGIREELDPSEAMLSLRDADSVPHVTLYLQDTRVFQAATFDDNDVLPRFRCAVDNAAAIIGPRLLLHNDPARAVSDGQHFRNGHTARIRRGMLHCNEGPALEREDGTKEWYCHGRLHREAGPAVERAGGTKRWYRHGELHRESGPAIEWADGSLEWYRDGFRHREDGPALALANGNRWWFLHGHLDRGDGPAVERADGTKEWYSGGKRHRDDGPAIERPDGSEEWYLDGQKVSSDDLCDREIMFGLRI